MSGIWADAIRSPGDSTRPDRAKFVPPRLPDNHVSRPRLYELLDRYVDARVTVICAPAGSGKSALLAGWASRRGHDVAWITLDDRDNDPAILAAHLEHALRVDVDRADEVYLVLDGAESLTAADEHALIPQLAHALPASVHLLVASRTRAGINLHRLRVEHDTVELDARDLCFTPAEAATLVVESGWTGVDLAAVIERTDGWATGLMLAVGGRAAAGGEHATREFLREQVFAKQPADIQRFLMETAFLEYFGAAAAERVTGRTDAADLLRKLEQDNAFIRTVDPEHLRYVYQPQFRDMLCDELRARAPERVHTVNIASARWCEQHGYLAEAMEHWLRAGREYDALLLLGRANVRFALARPALVGSWISRIQTSSARGDAQLLLALAESCSVIGDDERFLDVMDRVDAALLRSPDHVLETRASLLQARLALGAGDVESQVDWLEQARASLQGEQKLDRDLLLAALPRVRRLFPWLALGQIWLERTADARATLRDRPYTPQEDAVDRLFVGSVDAVVSFGEGRIDNAVTLALDTIDAAEGLEVDSYVVWPAVHVLAATMYERDNVTAAQAAFEELSRTERMPLGNTFAIVAQVGLASVLRSQGDPAEALERLSRLRRDQMNATRSVAAGWIDQATAITLLRLGQVGAARGILGSPRERSSELLIAALIELADGHADEASRLAASVRRDAPRSTLLATLIDAQAAKLRREEDAMLAGAQHAMRLARRYGFLRSVLDFGGDLLPEFEVVSTGADDAEFVAQLRHSERRSPGTIALRDSTTHSVELTHRELEVLRYLPTHLSIQEIARALYVSRNTVKSHAQHLYRKLGVDSREAAVERARSLNVLR